MGQEFELPTGFTLRKSWPKTTSDELFQSIIIDAVKDLGWKIVDKDSKIKPPRLNDAKHRKKMMQKILDSRVAEQQSNEDYREKLSKLKSRCIGELFDPKHLPDTKEGIEDLFTKVEIEPVLNDRSKEIFRYLRHSWRIPFKTTPGRTLSFIVRIGKERKIAGIFSLASPAMWMSNRDEALGFENFDMLDLSSKSRKDLEIYVDRFSGDRFSKKEKKELEAEEKLRLQKIDWMNRWRKAGLVDDSRRIHPNSGEFRVSELIESCMESLRKRILQFPVKTISDSENFAKRCRSLGISIKGTMPTNWITGTEPMSNETHRKRSKKRRRIVGECLDAYQTLHSWKHTVGLPATVEGLFESLHSPQEDDSEETQEDDSEEIIRALKRGIRESKTTMLSSNIAEMIICGSIPPLNPLRVGKLVAMLALSSETKEIWDDTYSTSSSLIASQLAGRPISKVASLSAISTTGLYGRSNAQYDRISIPLSGGNKVRFPMVGVTGTKGEGPSNLMISDRTWNLVSRYIEEKEIDGVSGKFGEGTSARIRRLQKAIQLMDDEVSGGAKINISKLLKKIISNPYSRSIHVANLSHNSIRFHLGIDESVETPIDLLSKDRILEIWKQRWLTPLLSREDADSDIIAKMAKCNLDDLLPPVEK